MLYSSIYGLISSIAYLVYMIVKTALTLSIPAINYIVWKSELRANIKLVYVSVSSLLILGIMMMMEVKRDSVMDDLYRKFDPSVTFYNKDVFSAAHFSNGFESDREMGLDTCIDPEGNLIDLKKRFKLDMSWVVVEIPDEFARGESMGSVLRSGGIRANSLAESSRGMRGERANQIKLEDFRFMDVYLKKEKIKYAGLRGGGMLYFDLEGATEESFPRYVNTVEEYQKNSRQNLNVLFTTSSNYLTNRLKSKRV